jgi:hypothetical protein
MTTKTLSEAMKWDVDGDDYYYYFAVPVRHYLEDYYGTRQMMMMTK